MARLNEFYIFVKEEKKSRGVDVTSHPVEKGLDITSNVKRKAVTLSLEGVIVKSTKLSTKSVKKTKTKAVKGAKLSLKNVPLYANSKVKKKKKSLTGTFYLWGTGKKNGRYRIVKKKKNVGKKKKYIGWIDAKHVIKTKSKTVKTAAKEVSANTIENEITKLHQSGKKVKYKGRCELKNAIITSFDTTQNSDIKDGFSFTMELKEIRIAEKAYKAKSKKKKSQKTNKKKSSKRYHTVKKGETLAKIAKKYYGDGSKMKAIYKANKKKIDKKNKGKKVSKYTVYKGQKLLIP